MRDHLKKYIDTSKTPHVRGLRILLEYFYATEIFEKNIGESIKVVSVFGSARSHPQTQPFRQAEKLGRLLYGAGFAVVTGASRGIMEAANLGVANAIAEDLVAQKKARSTVRARQTRLYKKRLKQHSVGLMISLPKEAGMNPYVGIEATFHYFMVRKFFFGTLSSAFVACEGGWGTRDELYEMLTLVQTGKAPVMPIVYLSSNPNHLRQDIHHTLKEGYISPEDIRLLDVVKTPRQVMQIISRFYRNVDRVVYERDEAVRIQFKKTVPKSRQRQVEEILVKGHKPGLSFRWGNRSLQLRPYAPYSYGFLRRAIDIINQS